ncbi:hypothetical protein LPTSP3_g19240 [Leptospira kobayashii]|uniref:Cytochrome c-type biogenesis protein n=1 Tax=Leptospira kobayashii TaxID=1917830 RepID=A0ABN6KDF0_9LEPT|nr:hypothetical protein LPTSP3_g19240 [Leptospira kobayashii]
MVRCPVCSHRFQFNPNDEKEIPGSFEEETIPSFQFQPSKGEYVHLIKDLLYAPIDFLKSKFGRKTNYIESEVFWKNPKFWIPILLFGILGLYLVRNLSWKSSEPLPHAQGQLQEEETDPNSGPMEEAPLAPEEEEIKPPGFEI